VAWQHNEPELAVDPIILGEIRFGILLLPRGRRRSRLERWFEDGVQRLQCIPWEASTGLRWAELLAMLRTGGRAMPIKDSLIAGDRAGARSGGRDPQPARLRCHRRGYR
jgi:predicted nucleic acid-binding protein